MTKIRKSTVLKLIILGLIILIPYLFIFVLPPHLTLIGPQDVDKITEGPYAGHYLVTDGMGFIKIINSATHTVLWETDEPEFFVHDADMMPGGYSIIVADTGNDRVFEMNLSNKVILWEWYAKNNSQNTYTDYWNWTEFAIAQGWSSKSIAIFENFNPPDGYYTHLNTVQFINGTLFNRTYDSILISLRNFDLVVEVNYTAKKGEPGYMNITWYYGIPGNYTFLNHQHAPKRWSNGHTTICDSENDRVIEINENNEVVWVYTDKHLRWVRDCEILPNGNYLITDSSNNRIIEVNKTTKKIVRTFTDFRLLIPYEADYIEEDNQIITGANQVVLMFDYDTGKVEDSLGFWYLFAPFLIILLIGITYQSITCILEYRKMSDKTWKQRLKSFNIYNKFISISVMIGTIIIFHYIFAFLWFYGIWHLLEHIPRPQRALS